MQNYIKIIYLQEPVDLLKFWLNVKYKGLRETQKTVIMKSYGLKCYLFTFLSYFG